MKKLYLYSADKPDAPYSELSVSESPADNGLAVFAVFESPKLEETYHDILRLIGWGCNLESGEPVNGDARSARILCSDICHAFLHLVRVPFVCRRAIDTKFADDGGGDTFLHGVKSATLSYTPSPEPFSTESA